MPRSIKTHGCERVCESVKIDIDVCSEFLKEIKIN